jgi:hypothetical protein
MRGASRISRDTCQASAETLTGITRDAFVVLQPKQHKRVGARVGAQKMVLAKMVLAQGVEP